MGVLERVGQWVHDVLHPPLVVTTLDSSPSQAFDTVPRPVDQVIADMLSNGWGGRVSRAQALSIPAVLRGRNELCSIATLPLRLYRGLDVLDSPLLRQLDLNLPNVVVLAATIEDLIFEGMAWWRITGRDFDGYPIAVERIDPGRISMNPPTSSTAALTPASKLAPGQGGQVWLDGKPTNVRDYVRFDSPNPGLLQAGARAVRRAGLLEQLASTFADNPRPLDYFTDSERTDVDPMDDDEVQKFLAEWQQLRKRSSTAWVPGNVQRVDVSTPSPAELQLVELQRQATLELANALGVDPEDLGVSTTSRTYFNAQDRAQQRINRTLAPYMSALTDRLSMGDVTRRGYVVRFDLSDYLKADPTTQVAYWRGLWDMGAISTAEIRAAAGFTGAPPAPTPAAAPPAPAAGTSRALPAGQRFDSGAAFVFSAVEFAGASSDTQVDEGARTITGLALPYGAIAQKFGVRYRFLPGSLEYGDVSRVKHLQDHVTPVGSVVKLEDTKAGLTATLSVLSGPEGSRQRLDRDALLYDAQHGLYDGLSVGVDFSLYPEDGDVEFNDDEQVYDVKRATLREISSTPMPAFDDARVTKVAASLTGGHMHCPHCGQPHAPGIACATFAAQLALAANPPQPTPPANPPANPPGQPAQPAPGTPPANPPAQPPTGEQFAAWLQQQLVPAQPAGPVVVDPTRQPFSVQEPAPYRFDSRGNLRAGSHDFSSDLLAGWGPGGGGDVAARDRAEAFLRAAFADGSAARTAVLEQGAGQQFAITPANVVNLNYPANRPDLYVDQLEYLYPLYNAVLKGSLDAVTPFVIPKFSSSSGLVADHVTGTEPTPGAFTATAQTITPTPLSGKVEITREALDQGGNPQMSGLIWRQMVRAWYEGLEAYVQAQLVANAASIPDITITTAAADSTLDQAISAALVPLQYIRGGDRFGTVFTQVDLYKAMAAAKDGQGRRLYPMYGAQNANGTVREGYSAIDAHGKLWLPAWATAASSVNAGSSWMFDPDVVCLWASAPQRIDLQWRVAWVDMGIWGYKAFGVTDFTRTRELVYDPV